MQFEVKIDSTYIEPKVIILTASITEDVRILLNKLSEETPKIISGSKNSKIEVIEQDDLIRIYASLPSPIKVNTHYASGCTK